MPVDHVAFLHQLLHDHKRDANLDFVRAITSLVPSVLNLFALGDSFDLRAYLVAEASGVSG